MKERGITTAVIAAVIVIIVIMAGVGAYFLMEPGPEGEGEITEPATLTQITFSGFDYDPDWSPDGTKIVFSKWEEQTQTNYIINADGTGLREIGPGFDPSWSPVEDKIAYTMNNQIYTMNSNGENITQLTSEDVNAHPAWNPDGTKIAYVRYETEGPSIWVMNSDGSEKTQLTTPTDGECLFPSFSYDGSKIVYAIGLYVEDPPTTPNEIWVMGNDGSDKHQIYAPGNSYQWIFQRAWNKDNKILFARFWFTPGGPDIWTINSDGTGASAVVEAQQYCYADPAWNNAGDEVAIVKRDGASQNVFIFSYE